jgi:hypothetical protein
MLDERQDKEKILKTHPVLQQNVEHASVEVQSTRKMKERDKDRNEERKEKK